MCIAAGIVIVINQWRINIPQCIALLVYLAGLFVINVRIPFYCWHWNKILCIKNVTRNLRLLSTKILWVCILDSIVLWIVEQFILLLPGFICKAIVWLVFRRKWNVVTPAVVPVEFSSIKRAQHPFRGSYYFVLTPLQVEYTTLLDNLFGYFYISIG